jgi:hypothetical protein
LVQPFRPEFLVPVEPIVGVTHWFRPQAAAHDATALLAPDKSGIRQDVEMLHDCRQRHRKRLGKLADREAFLFTQPGEQCAARRVCQRGESAIKIWSWIVNHLVKYRIVRRGVKTLRIYLSLTKDVRGSPRWTLYHSHLLLSALR